VGCVLCILSSISHITPVRAQVPSGTAARMDWSGVDVADIVVTKVTTQQTSPGRRFREYQGIAPYTVTYNPQWKEPGKSAILLHRAAKGDSAVKGFTTVTPDGIRKLVGKGYYFEFASPDGKTIYATRPNAGLYAITFDGKNVRKITSRPVHYCKLSPDGKYILSGVGWKYSPQEGRYFAQWSGPESSHAVMKIDGTGFRTVARPMVWKVESGTRRDGTTWHFTRYQAMKVEWSGDGKSLLLHKGMQIIRMNPDGTGEKKLATDASPEHGRVRFSPTGKWVIFEGGWVRNGKGEMEGYGAKPFAIRVADGKRIPLPSSPNVFGARLLGDNLVYLQTRRELTNPGQKRRLKSGIEVPVGPVHRTVTEWSIASLENPTKAVPLHPKETPWSLWNESPDNRIIAYVERQSGLLGFIAVENPAIRHQTRIRVPNTMSFLQWSEGGRVLAYHIDKEKVSLTLENRPASKAIKAMRSLERTIVSSWVNMAVAGVVTLLIFAALGVAIRALFRWQYERRITAQYAENKPSDTP
jgi:hypothetical protein